MYSLKINFEQKGLETVTLENVAADQSLLEVLLDAGIELHHIAVQFVLVVLFIYMLIKAWNILQKCLTRKKILLTVQ
jgi:hypothetical protein